MGDFTQKMLTGDSRNIVESTSDQSMAIISSVAELAANDMPFRSSDTSEPHFRSPDDFLRLAKWKVNDLSFLVGSDLAIFGTKLHPCISLRLR